MNSKKLILVGIVLVLISHFINFLSSRWFYEPFLFPVAFIVAAIYGWWSRNYIFSFFVGFLSIPYFIPFPPFYSGGILIAFVKTLLGLADYNLLELLIFLSFGIISGLIGVGFVKLSNLLRR